MKCLALLFFSAICSHAQTLITFDDLKDNGDGTQIPNGYAGLDWSNFYVLNTQDYEDASGYKNGVVSSPNVAFNAYADASSISSTLPFTLTAAQVTSAWNNGLTIVAQAFVGPDLKYQNTYIVNTTGPTLIVFNYANVTSVDFTSSGGTPAGYDGEGAHFLLDDVGLNGAGVPETRDWAPFLTLGVLLALGVRHYANRERLQMNPCRFI